jgi:chromosome partitioning protein
MHVITFANSKGGGGKTTLSASIGVAAMQAGEKVFLIDLDPQQSLMAWGERRQADEPGVDRISADKLADAITGLRNGGYTLAICDTPGVDTAVTAEAIRCSDLVLIPNRASILDLQGCKPTLGATLRLGRPTGLILNACSSGHSARIEDAGRALTLLGKLGPPICQRVDHLDSMIAGLGVTEHSPQGRAAEEIKALWQWIKDRLEGAHGQAAVA